MPCRRRRRCSRRGRRRRSRCRRSRCPRCPRMAAPGPPWGTPGCRPCSRAPVKSESQLLMSGLQFRLTARARCGPLSSGMLRGAHSSHAEPSLLSRQRHACSQAGGTAAMSHAAGSPPAGRTLTAFLNAQLQQGAREWQRALHSGQAVSSAEGKSRGTRPQARPLAIEAGVLGTAQRQVNVKFVAVRHRPCRHARVQPEHLLGRQYDEQASGLAWRCAVCTGCMRRIETKRCQQCMQFRHRWHWMPFTYL